MTEAENALAAAQNALGEAHDRKREAEAFVALAHEEYIEAGRAVTAALNRVQREEWELLKGAVKAARDAKKQPQITSQAKDEAAKPPTDITGDTNVRW
ncbi:MAG TPA: hypothetical protein VHY82_16045 [Acetobacteraceae bacterium]|jgi:hypothetical protein|nr:hypothetical protein [Acetobacteraceae bacterium]